MFFPLVVHALNTLPPKVLLLGALVVIFISSCSTSVDDTTPPKPAETTQPVDIVPVPTHFEHCSEADATVILLVNIVHRGLGDQESDIPMRPVPATDEGFRWPYPGKYGTGSGHGVTEQGEPFSIGGSVVLEDSASPGVDLDLYIYNMIGDHHEVFVEQSITIPYGTKTERRLHEEISLQAEFIDPKNVDH